MIDRNPKRGGLRNDGRPLDERFIPPAFETIRGSPDCGFDLCIGQFLECLEGFAIIRIYTLVGFGLQFGRGFEGYFFGAGGGEARVVPIFESDHTPHHRMALWGVNPIAKAWQRTNIPDMKKKSKMQLGMIGLDRMGANMVRRLIKDGHCCVAFDQLPKSDRTKLVILDLQVTDVPTLNPRFKPCIAPPGWTQSSCHALPFATG
jgi:hypothetical protein